MADGVMVALLPVTDDWCRIEVPHMTLVYAGKTGDLPASAQNDLAKECASLAMLAKPLTLSVMGKDVFGEGTDEDPKVDVFLLRSTPELLAMRKAFERWNASQHPGFRPHCTIGPEGTFLEFMPRLLGFERLCLQWGDEQMAFKLSY